MRIIIHFLCSFGDIKKRGMLSVILCHILQPEGKISVALLKKKYKMKSSVHKTFKVNYFEVKIQLLVARQGVRDNCTSYECDNESIDTHLNHLIN